MIFKFILHFLHILLLQVQIAFKISLDNKTTFTLIYYENIKHSLFMFSVQGDAAFPAIGDPGKLINYKQQNNSYNINNLNKMHSLSIFFIS